MKKILFSILILTAIITLLCCKKSFLQSTSQDGSLTDQGAFQNTAFFDSYIFGAYSELQGGTGVFAFLLVSGGIMQDITQVDETQQAIPTILTPGDTYTTANWTAFYKIAGRVNTILSKLETAPASIADSDKVKLDGEAKFLRGYSYFNLARAYGDIPLLLTTFTQSQVSKAQTPEDSVWDQVIRDLTDASKELPTREGWGPSNLGRATKGSALAYLANAYMYKKNWANAKLASESLIALNEYSLLPNVRDVFSELHGNTNESIFEVQYRELNDGNILWSGQPNQGNTSSEWTAPRNIGSQWAPAGGWGQNTTNIKLANSFEPGDNRRSKLMVTVGDTYQGELMTAPLTIPNTISQSHSAFTTKYWFGPSANPNASYYHGPNLIQMRYAEFLLNYSEILFQLGDPNGAYQQLNLIRERAKLADKPVSSDINTFLNDLMNERRWELNWEPNLWFHYLRTGTAANFLQNVYGITMLPAWNRYPIPQADIDLNPKLKQNQGY